MNSALVVAQAFLDLAHVEGQIMTAMRLHKLMFLAQISHHAAGRGRLIREDAQAWEYGPIYPLLWDYHGIHGADPLPNAPLFYRRSMASPHPHAFVVALWQGYKPLSTLDLSALVRVPPGPWAQTRAAYQEDEHPVISDVLVHAYGQSLRHAVTAKQTVDADAIATEATLAAAVS